MSRVTVLPSPSDWDLETYVNRSGGRSSSVMEAEQVVVMYAVVKVRGPGVSAPLLPFDPPPPCNSMSSPDWIDKVLFYA